MKGSLNHNWKGGIHINNYGYREIRRPDHRLSRNSYVLEHIIIFEEYHKCCVLPWTNIHHIDENRQNNNIENLQGMTRSQHMRYHKIKLYAERRVREREFR